MDKLNDAEYESMSHEELVKCCYQLSGALDDESQRCLSIKAKSKKRKKRIKQMTKTIRWLLRDKMAEKAREVAKIKWLDKVILGGELINKKGEVPLTSTEVKNFLNECKLFGKEIVPTKAEEESPEEGISIVAGDVFKNMETGQCITAKELWELRDGK